MAVVLDTISGENQFYWLWLVVYCILHAQTSLILDVSLKYVHKLLMEEI